MSLIRFCQNCFLVGVRRTTPKGDIMYDLEKKINEAVFPGLQGGPHDNVIAGLNHLLYSPATTLVFLLQAFRFHCYIFLYCTSGVGMVCFVEIVNHSAWLLFAECSLLFDMK